MGLEENLNVDGLSGQKGIPGREWGPGPCDVGSVRGKWARKVKGDMGADEMFLDVVVGGLFNGFSSLLEPGCKAIHRE